MRHPTRRPLFTLSQPAPRCSAEAQASGGAPRHHEAPRQADARRPRRRAPRVAERGAPAGTTSQAGAGRHNKWPLTRRTRAPGWGRSAGYAEQPAVARPPRAVGCAAAGYAAPDPAAPLPSLTRRRLDPAPRRDRAAKRRDTTRRRARLTRAALDIERRGWQNEASRAARRHRLAPGRITDGRSPAAQRAMTTETERRIRRAAREATTDPCGRLCSGRLCGLCVAVETKTEELTRLDVERGAEHRGTTVHHDSPVLRHV